MNDLAELQGEPCLPGETIQGVTMTSSGLTPNNGPGQGKEVETVDSEHGATIQGKRCRSFQLAPDHCSQGQGGTKKICVTRFRLETRPATSGWDIWQIGDYTVRTTSSLGEGGLGTVYAAKHSGGREVALKVGNPMDVKDFTWQTSRTEWNAYVSLTHDQPVKHIARAYHFGIYSSPMGIVPWMTMELLGPSLFDLRSKRIISQDDARRLGASSLQALQWLHGRGFLHRDMKPENLVVPHGWMPGQPLAVKLIDLGMAQIWQAGGNSPQPPFAGTPDYASTASLHEREIGPKDDVESLGYTLLFLWLGRLPWAGLPSMLSARDSGPSGWTQEELAIMAETRDIAYENALDAGFVPDFLEQWLDHCRFLDADDLPDYAFLTDLLTGDTKTSSTSGGRRSCTPALGPIKGVEPQEHVLACEE